MAYNTKAILRDLNGDPIPQYYDESADIYKPAEGDDNGQRVKVPGLETLVGALADAAVTNPAATASVIAALKGILTDLGQTDDAVVAAGAVGSLAAKIRRVSTDLAELMANVGDVTDAEATGSGVDGSLVALLKEVRDLLTDGDALMQLNGRRVAVATGDYSQVLNVAAAGNTTITITPAADELWRIINILASVARPTGSSTGTHDLEVGYDTNNATLLVRSNFDQTVNISRNVAGTAAASAWPDSDASQRAAVAGMVVTNAMPLKITYRNNTDVLQDNTLSINVVREVEYIVT